MKKAIKLMALTAAGTALLSVLIACNIFGGGNYKEVNGNGYRAVELNSPQKDIGSLNRLAFGVSSRKIKETPVPTVVFTDEGESRNFAPWGNIIKDSDDLTDPLIPDPKKGDTRRQIELTAINETKNAGKIAGSEDGISFYFKELNYDTNFRLTADFYIDVYGFTTGSAELNGQEAFGIMARDWVPQHSSISSKGHNLTMDALKNVPWNGVYWNGQDTSLDDGISGSSNMIMVGGVKRGTRVYWRTGVTDPDGEEKPITDPNAIANADFAKFDYQPKEFSDYSMYGTGIEGTKNRPDFPTAGLKYTLYLEKTNSGFKASIEPPSGVGKGITKDRKVVDGFKMEWSDRDLAFPDMLTCKYQPGECQHPNGICTAVKRDKYYVGFFVARDAKVTVSNIRYEESQRDTCPPRVEPTPKPITPSFAIESPRSSSVEDYILYATSNVEGTMQLSINGAAPKVYPNEWIIETSNASAQPFALFKVEGIKLKKGDNTFDAVFVPDRGQAQSKYLPQPNDTRAYLEYQMTDTNPVSRSLIVNRRDLAGTKADSVMYGVGKNGYEREIIWAAPDGTPSGSGSKENPLDVVTAVAVSAPGQVIMLKDGIYSPLDPKEMVDGKMRTPIRMVIPRYNSGLPNPDASAPQPRPASPNDGIPYPDPYNDPYYKYYKVLKAENRDKAIFDFRKDLSNSGYFPRAFENRGDRWIIDGIHVRNAGDNQKGLTITGQYNLIRWVKAYFNGDAGIQISGNNNEPKSMWPAYNRIEYCESFGNSDVSTTNADGFAQKLTAWEGNVFYRCIGHHNIDDAWDLFAKKETGPIGAAIIEQSFAYMNSRYLNDEMAWNYSDRTPKPKGNDHAGAGNGFKMGGEGIPVLHQAINCLSWGNAGDGFTSNSDPAIRLTHCSSFDNYFRNDGNPAANFAIYSSSSPSYEGLDAVITQLFSWWSDPRGKRNDRLEPMSPSSGYVWRNSSTRRNAEGYNESYEVYDGNNGKDSAVLLISMATGEKTFDTSFPVYTGRSVSTQYVDGKELQNGTRVNKYMNNHVMTIDNFYENPKTIFDNGLYYEVGGVRVSPFGVDGDKPYRRLDGTEAPNRWDGRIEGDFLEVYQEGDYSVAPYYWGLPKLHKFMQLRDVPGVTPGALGLWAD
jgi:hypothetical protein